MALQKISPAWVPTNSEWLPENQNNEFLSKPFQFTEFNIALESRNTSSFPGVDEIDYEILKSLPINYKLLLLDILNDMYESGNFPDEWKKQYIHFIKKLDGINYRPIPLSSCVCKLFEILIKNRLLWYIEHDNLLSPAQSGFRKGQSCVDNLADLILKIEDGLKANQHALGAFLDITSAFDNVDCQLLLKILAENHCLLNLIKFVKFLVYETDLYELHRRRI